MNYKLGLYSAQILFLPIHCRKDNLLQVSSLASVEAILADLSSLPVVPLLQLALAINKTAEEEEGGGAAAAAAAAAGGGLVK